MRKVEYITPNCCDKAKETKTVRLGYYLKENESKCTWKKVKPKWYLIGDEFIYDVHFNIKVEIDKCPFCGKELPDVELNDKKLKIVDGDEEYCDTCGERHMCCNCYPPEYRWKIKNNNI
jgi:hypothetical protein